MNDELPPLETAPGPVHRATAAPRWLGVPAGLVLLCVGFAALGAAVGLFVAGHWPWGLVLLGVAILLLVGLGEASRHHPPPELAQRSSLAVADGRSRAQSSWQVLRARVDGQVERRRASAQLRAVEREHGEALEQLGRAVWDGDEGAEERARERLRELDERREAIERELSSRLDEAGERIRKARLPVEQTMMVAPNEPSPPYPPPGEADPPQPAIVPEPYPPPDEGTPPTPAPDPGRPDPGE
jgi:hypothetical protein